MLHGTFKAMGSQISWWADRDVEDDLAAVFEEIEACCSRFREDSELSKLNRADTEIVEVSHLMAEILRAADEAHRISGGLVDPTVLEAVSAAGYDRDLASARKTRSTTPQVPGWDLVAVSDNQVRRPPGVGIDLGGIAKGWAAQKALHVEGASLVDAAGDMATRGPWIIAVKHACMQVADLEVYDAGVATSGIDRRTWQDGHHLIDPRTGAPSDSDVLAATVVAGNVPLAETIARSIVLMGAWDGLGFAESIPEVHGALATTREGVTLSFPRTAEVLA